MDIITQMRLHQISCTLLFERICWYYPLHYDVISYDCTNMMYHQAIQLYLDGWLIALPPSGSKVPHKLTVSAYCQGLFICNIFRLFICCIFPSFVYSQVDVVTSVSYSENCVIGFICIIRINNLVFLI